MLNSSLKEISQEFNRTAPTNCTNSYICLQKNLGKILALQYLKIDFPNSFSIKIKKKTIDISDRVLEILLLLIIMDEFSPTGWCKLIKSVNNSYENVQFSRLFTCITEIKSNYLSMDIKNFFYPINSDEEKLIKKMMRNFSNELFKIQPEHTTEDLTCLLENWKKLPLVVADYNRKKFSEDVIENFYQFRQYIFDGELSVSVDDNSELKKIQDYLNSIFTIRVTRDKILTSFAVFNILKSFFSLLKKETIQELRTLAGVLFLLRIKQGTLPSHDELVSVIRNRLNLLIKDPDLNILLNENCVENLSVGNLVCEKVLEYVYSHYEKEINFCGGKKDGLGRRQGREHFPRYTAPKLAKDT